VLKTATQSAGNVVAPVLKTATQSAGNVVAAATDVTQGGSSVTQSVVNVANPPVITGPQVLLSAPTAEHVSSVLTHVAPHVGDISLSRAINVPLSGSGSITRAISPTMPAAASHGGTFSGTGAVRVVAGRPSSTSRCLLAGPEDRLIESCGAGAARPPTVLSVLPFGEASAAIASLDGLAAGPASTAARGGSPPDRVRGSVAPSPAPGGITGSTAAAWGLALSISLTLTSVLLLGRPRVMRRLRLFIEPWCSARFVLMPERPG